MLFVNARSPTRHYRYLQARNYDPEGRFMRHWLPELAGAPTDALIDPRRLPPPLRAAARYPPPIVALLADRGGPVQKGSPPAAGGATSSRSSGKGAALPGAGTGTAIAGTAAGTGSRRGDDARTSTKGSRSKGNGHYRRGNIAGGGAGGALGSQ